MDELKDFKGDKRSREYRELKAKFQLGDAIAKVTEVTGIKKVVDALTDGGCGCSERQVKFNEFGDKVLRKLSQIFRGRLKDLSEADYNYLCEFFKDGIPSEASPKQQVELNKIYFNVSSIIKAKTSCSTCVVQTVRALYELYITYKPLTK